MARADSDARSRSREFVFGQLLFGFELTQQEARVVGVNLVHPEEDENSLRYYEDEMKAIGFLHRQNLAAMRLRNDPQRQVHISLHAGELAQAVLPQTPEGQRHLGFHIRRAVEVADAERIGHSTDLFSEKGPGLLGARGLLLEMRLGAVAVEICLTSNQQLLGVAGAEHPLAAYLDEGVPVTLATDDPGILRTSLTQEYVRAAQEHQLSYRALKAIARNSLEYSFLEGHSLWRDPRGPFAVDDCMGSEPAAPRGLESRCAVFLSDHRRAAQQWELEVRLAAFEQMQLAQQQEAARSK